MSSILLGGMPTLAPAAPNQPLRYMDIAVTATASEFAGHYRGKQYHEPDFDAVLDRAAGAGVERVMLTGMYLADIDFNLAIARRRPEQCRLTVGVHPYHAAEAVEDTTYLPRLFDQVDVLLNEEPCLLAAYGELGLDYDHTEKASKEVQCEVFRTQLDLIVARNIQLPLFLHCRAAFDDFIDILTPYISRLARPKDIDTDRDRGIGIVHSFVGPPSQMHTLASLGLHISINGFSFRDRESLQMIQQIPLSHLQLETDAPWGTIPPSSEVARRYLGNMAPLPVSKKRDKFEMGLMVKERNESCTIERVAGVVAGVRECTIEEVASAAWRNSEGMFLGEVEGV